MAAKNPGFQKPGTQRGLGCGIAFGIVFLITLGAVGYFVVRARLVNDVLTTYLNTPVSFQQVEAGQPVTIQASATYPRGVSRVEVYADGALISAQDSSSQGETTLSLINAWISPTSGRHVLMARGYASDDLFADSQVVYLEVTEPSANIQIDVDKLKRPDGAPNPSLNDLATALGTTPEELVRRNPSLGGSDPAAPIPPGLSVEAPRPPEAPRPEPTPLAPPTRNPAPPTGLTGTADCTSVTLTWNPSRDARYYRVYRLGPGPSEFSPSLRAEGLSATTYRDVLPGPGDYIYQVASMRNLRSGQEGLSRTFTISTPASCPVPGAPPGTAADLVLTIAMVDTTETWDGVYCYLSVNGRAHERIPAGDSNFLAPETANPRYYNLTRLPGGGRVMNFTGQPLTSPITLEGECHGRRGPISTRLGGFNVSHPRAEWDGTLRSASGTGNTYRFSYCLGPSSAPCTPTIPGASGYTGLYLDIPTQNFYIPPPTNLHRTVSIEACMDLPTRQEQIDCAGASGVYGRQTLFWDWTGTPTVPESSLTGYIVFQGVYEQTTHRYLTGNSWNVNRRADGSLPKRFLPEERNLNCGQDIVYSVLANQAGNRSRISEEIWFSTEPCLAAADVTITFLTLRLGAVEDTGEEYGFIVPAIDDDLEVDGSIFANGGTMSPTNSSTYGVYGISLTEGLYMWSVLDMYYPGPHVVNEHGRGHDVFRTRISDAQQTISFGVWLTDIDTHWTGVGIISNVVFCNSRVTLPGQSPERWSRVNENFTLTDGNAEGDCTVTVNVHGAPAR